MSLTLLLASWFWYLMSLKTWISEHPVLDSTCIFLLISSTPVRVNCFSDHCLIFSLMLPAKSFIWRWQRSPKGYSLRTLCHRSNTPLFTYCWFSVGRDGEAAEKTRWHCYVICWALYLSHSNRRENFGVLFRLYPINPIFEWLFTALTEESSSSLSDQTRMVIFSKKVESYFLCTFNFVIQNEEHTKTKFEACVEFCRMVMETFHVLACNTTPVCVHKITGVRFCR